MTTEQAKTMLTRIKDKLNFEDTDAQKKMDALNMAIKVLDQEPCEGAISRVAAIDKLDEWDWQEFYLPIHFKELLDELPPVRAEKVGCWVGIDDEPHEVWECDHCGFVIDGSGCVDPYEYRDIYKYCPNCGAKMEEEIETCKDCTNKCIMYEPKMKGCKDKMEGVE